MQVVSHRGIDMDCDQVWIENSVSALNRFLLEGVGVECDLAFSADGHIVLFHDKTLTRVTQNRDPRPLHTLSFETLKSILGIELYRFDDFLKTLIRFPVSFNAVHFKGPQQTEANIGFLIDALKSFPNSWSQFIIFDCRLATACRLKEALPGIKLAPSVAHPFDIARFNAITDYTLYSLEEVLAHIALFDWVWLDEWDRKDERGGSKSLYNATVFAKCRSAGLRIGLVTPELHKSSPGLLGNESHEDGQMPKLMDRISELLSLSPDLVCTDFPSRVQDMVAKCFSQKVQTVY